MSILTLAQVARRVVNLDDRIIQDDTISPLVDCRGVVRLCVLNGTRSIVTVKRRFVPGDGVAAVKHTLHETFIWSFLRHQNVHPLLGIVTIFDDRAVSTVAGYMPRGNAHNLVQDPRVNPAFLLLELAHALHYLHTFRLGPIFHGDVRGENVLVTDDGHALLTNFGCSFFHDRASGRAYFPPLPGALRWMAPEGIEDEKNVTAYRDVWAFAMTVMELFTRKHPFKGINSQGMIMVRILSGMPDRPDHMDDEWWTLCTSCWDFDPAGRPNMWTLIHNIKVGKTILDRDGWRLSTAEAVTIMASSRNPLMKYQISPHLLRTADSMSNYNAPLISTSVETRPLALPRG